MTEEQDHSSDAVHGIAALSLLDAIIVTLLERGQITEEELDDAFIAAIEAHQSAGNELNKDTNSKVVTILERLQVRGRSINLD